MRLKPQNPERDEKGDERENNRVKLVPKGRSNGIGKKVSE